MSSSTTSALRVAILGSGQGSIADAILAYQEDRKSCRYRVVAVISSAPEAGILEVGRKYHVETHALSSTSPPVMEHELLTILRTADVQLLVLAGFLRLLPLTVITQLGGRVINTHPALLPKYGGKGMYGRRVHEAVVRAKEPLSGATVHWVTEQYDEGQIVAQQSVELRPDDDVNMVEHKVKTVERELLPKTIEKLAELVQ